MKLKCLFQISLLFLVTISGFSQQRQSDTTETYKSIIPTEKQNLLSNVDLIANTQFAFRNDFSDGDYASSKFRMEQFRMEAKGWVTKNLFFRFRHRFTSSFQPQSVDKIIKGVDLAFITAKLGEKWKLTLGKTYADWGGIEFDLNPINVYEYSDIIEEADNFLSGAGLSVQATANHSFGLQILNPRTQNFTELYQVDTFINLIPEQSKAPLATVLTWRGSFLEGKLNTIWSYSLFKEAKDNSMNYIALGQQLSLGNFSIAYDYKLSLEDIDRTGIITRDILNSPTFSGDLVSFTFSNTRYQSHYMNLKYQFNPQWIINLTGFMDLAHTKLAENGDYEKIRTGMGIVPSLQYFPWNDLNLKFFLTYVGRTFEYETDVKTNTGLVDFGRSKILIGFSSPLKIL